MTKYNPFKFAKPVWAQGLTDEMNCTLGFYKKITSCGKATFKIATSGFYRLLINGDFSYYGPARAPHGFFRIDEFELELPKGEVHIAFEVINHRAKSYGVISNSAFFTAEIEDGGKTLAATGSDNGFEIYVLTHRTKKVQRYGFQRPFAEGYRLNCGFADWARGKEVENATKVKAEACGQKEYIKRNIRHHKFTPLAPQMLVSKGFVKEIVPQSYYRHFSLTDAGKTELEGYKIEELEFSMSDEAQELVNSSVTECGCPAPKSFSLKEKEFNIFSLEGERTGFISLKINCKNAGSLYITFDEILSDGDVSSYRMDCCNVIRLDLQKGIHEFCSMECYGFKFIKLTAKTGEFEISGLHLKEYVCPEPLCDDLFKSEDEQINCILEAAKQTFSQNSADMFMDCPTRERAGWLCDSFFLGRSEYYFTGANTIEHNYLENYLLPESYPNVPKGMVPMCYPSDHGCNSFIPNWAMWLILELEEHKHRTGDLQFISRFEGKIKGILDWFRQYENQDGLLERVPGWVFVEWSAANDFTKDINFPTNMLYVRTLEAAARLLCKPELSDKAAALKETVLKRSFDGEFFVDNEVYVDGVLTRTNNRTETCQYYAFFTGVATPKTHTKLWQRLLKDFGPDRTRKGLFPEIHPSNAFIGNYLRLMLLDENGLYEQLLNESKGYFLYMAERTGTLWEFISTEASCNHGFASYTAPMIKNAIDSLKNQKT